MTDYTAHDIHRLDQAYPDAVNTIDDLTGNPARKARLAEVGPEVFAAELTRELADGYYNPMSIAAWAAVATVQLMTAAKAWQDDTDAAWAKVAVVTAERDLNSDLLDGAARALGLDMDYAHVHHEILGKVNELSAELTAVAAAIAPTVTITPTSAAARFLHNLYEDWVKTAHERLEQIDKLTAELDKVREHLQLDRQAVATLRQREQRVSEQLTAANRRADGLQADLDSAQRGLTTYANENARLRQDRDTKTDIARCNARNFNTLAEVIERVEQRANAHAAVVEAARAWAASEGIAEEGLLAALAALPKAEATR